VAAELEWTLDDLRHHLQAAVELELLVIPPYLCALYSLHPGSNLEATLIIRSVVVEEMLHMILAANVLRSVDGRPTVTDPEWLPRYPAAIPYHTPDTFEVGLLPFGNDALDAFLAIENPSYRVSRRHSAPAYAAIPRATQLAPDRGYKTVGAFYTAIQDGLRSLDERLGHDALFTGGRELQIGPEHYYASGGSAIVVDDRESACSALEEIIEQGEGEVTKPRSEEKFEGAGDLAHFYRFNELRRRRRYRVDDTPATPTGPRIELDLNAVYPMKPNLRVDELAPGELYEAMTACNRVYSRLLWQIQRAFDGEHDELTGAVGTMFELKDSAIDLMRVPLPGGDGQNAGPTFEYLAID
jgi:hypothetical protein